MDLKVAPKRHQIPDGALMGPGFSGNRGDQIFSTESKALLLPLYYHFYCHASSKEFGTIHQPIETILKEAQYQVF